MIDFILVSFCNLGIYKGTCVLIEKELGRKLVWLPCRHHIMEIIMRGVFEVLWKTTSGPNVPIFIRFKKFWDKVDQSNYKSGIEDETVANTLIEKKAEIFTFINNCLQMSQPRDDYQELLLLCLVFLDSSYEKSFLLNDLVPCTMRDGCLRLFTA
ncbi:uncharacterized protein LOC123272225 [Cotesia glomerata]|uniref:uncharacterized protein LOC123272225 n=1 Tax=Cotesia glomerata TaxID=32391 RepID=UPI001D033A9D|nr:uncharacterized protein LOC123272225 [Cotesia glomerata]